jgi:hypothetical protein
MGRPKSFRNPTRVSLTIDGKTLREAREIARRNRRSLSETVSEILDTYLRKNVRPSARRLS